MFFSGWFSCTSQLEMKIIAKVQNASPKKLEKLDFYMKRTKGISSWILQKKNKCIREVCYEMSHFSSRCCCFSFGLFNVRKVDRPCEKYYRIAIFLMMVAILSWQDMLRVKSTNRTTPSRFVLSQTFILETFYST